MMKVFYFIMCNRSRVPNMLSSKIHWCWLSSLFVPLLSPSELFTTEVSHLRTLKVLDQVFFQKMRSVLNSDELACIFPNLPQVYELHGQSVFLCVSGFLCLNLSVTKNLHEQCLIVYTVDVVSVITGISAYFLMWRIHVWHLFTVI